jgi:dUTP pyrophosphatase
MMTFYPTIRVKRVNPDAPLPTKAHPTDAAYDLCAMEDVTLRPGEYKMVGSGLAFAIPQGWCGVVYPRSGLGCKGLVLKNTCGLIDAHYRGEVMLPLFNNNPTHVWLDSGGPASNTTIIELVPNPKGVIHIHKGDRVAQMRIELVPESTMQEADELDVTDRDQGGFGSSGITGGERL